MSEELKVGYYVKFPEETGEGYGKVTTKEPFNYETTSTTAEFSSVSTGSESGFKEMANLDPRQTPKELLQMLVGVEDGCDYYIKNRAGTNRFGVYKKQDVGHITALKSHHLAMDELYEIWLIYNYYPSINADNATGSSVTPKVWFEGLKYNYESVTDEGIIAKLDSGELHSRTIILGGVQV